VHEPRVLTRARCTPQDGYIMRWQRWMILVTLVLSTLLTSIWCVAGLAVLRSFTFLSI
jgi:hypothetical protein